MDLETNPFITERPVDMEDIVDREVELEQLVSYAECAAFCELCDQAPALALRV